MKKQENASKSSQPSEALEAVVAPSVLAEAVKQRADETGFAGMLAVVGQPGKLRIVTDAGNYPLPEGYDYIVLMLAKPEEGEPTVAWLRAEETEPVVVPAPVAEPVVVGQVTP